MPFDWIYQLSLIPTYLLHGFALTRFIRFGRPHIFWFLWLVLHIGMNCIVRGGSPWLNFMIIVFLWTAVPFFISDENPSRKLFACGLAFVVMMVAEILVSLFWIAVTGSNNTLYAAQANITPYILMRTVHLLVLTILFLAAYRLWSHRVKEVRDSTLLLFAAFPLTQGALLFCLVFIGAFLVINQSIFLWAATLALVCILADLILFFALRQLGEKQLAERGSFDESGSPGRGLYLRAALWRHCQFDPRAYSGYAALVLYIFIPVESTPAAFRIPLAVMFSARSPVMALLAFVSSCAVTVLGEAVTFLVWLVPPYTEAGLNEVVRLFLTRGLFLTVAIPLQLGLLLLWDRLVEKASLRKPCAGGGSREGNPEWNCCGAQTRLWPTRRGFAMSVAYA